MVTNNIKDFRPLAAEWLPQGRGHAGLILLPSTRTPTRSAIAAVAAAIENALRDHPDGLSGSERWRAARAGRCGLGVDRADRQGEPRRHIRVNAVRRPLIRLGQAWRHPSVAGHGESPVCSAESWLAWAEDFEDDPQQQRHAKEQAGIAE